MAKSLYTPTFPVQKHPNAPSITAKVDQYFLMNWPWTSEETPTKFLEEELAASAAWTLPNIPDDDKIETLTKWFVWGFLFDDILEVKGSMTTEYLKTLLKLILGKELPDRTDKLQAVTYDIHQSFVNNLDEGSNELGQAALQANIEWIVYQMEAVNSRDRPVMMSLDEYMADRIAKIGAKTVWLSLRWGLNIKLPQSVLGHELFRRLEDIADEYTVLTNDLYSYRKEVKDHQKHGDQGLLIFDNAVAVIMKEKEVKDNAAYEDIYVRLRSLESEYWRMEELVKSEFDGQEKEDLGKYLENLRFFVSGIHAWSSYSARYNRE